MKDIIYTKTTKDNLWTNNPHIAFSLMIFPITILFIASIFIIPPLLGFLIWIEFFLVLIVPTVLTLKLNQRYNMSKSTAFIKRNNILYVVQLLYTKKDLGKAYKNTIYAPSGSILEAATLDNNIKAAEYVQTHEKEIRERRKNINNFSLGLTDILTYLAEKPKRYSVIPNEKRSKIDNIFMYDLENNGMCDISTKNAEYKFLILKNPKIINKNKKTFTVSFDNEKGEYCTAKFTNCFDGIIEEIEKGQ